jgi:hypothetical protein
MEESRLAKQNHEPQVTIANGLIEEPSNHESDGKSPEHPVKDFIQARCRPDDTVQSEDEPEDGGCLAF